ncbi:MAG: hypothetical protein ACFB2X_16070 [Rivularia sp. (in: cyanobacteria)]
MLSMFYVGEESRLPDEAPNGFPFNFFLLAVMDFFKPFIDNCNSFICLFKHSDEEDILPFIEA